ncbi:MAG: hypothetical protein WBB27_07320, partial [Maribacter sp.]
MKRVNLLSVVALSLGIFLASCDPEDGIDGINGIDGQDGAQGPPGADGVDGQDATDPMMINAADLLLASIAADGGVP